MTGRIYCIKNNINDKVYIGKTIMTVRERFREHCCDCYRRAKEKRPLYSAMRKYGPKNFSVTLVDEVDYAELDEAERYYIQKFDSYYNGYNATLGGEGKLLYDHKTLVEDYTNGTTIQDIAKKYGCSIDTVSSAVHNAGFNGRENRNEMFKRKVLQFDKNGNFIQEFQSQTDAALWLMQHGQKGSCKTVLTNIGRVINGSRKTTAGYVWKAA